MKAKILLSRTICLLVFSIATSSLGQQTEQNKQPITPSVSIQQVPGPSTPPQPKVIEQKPGPAITVSKPLELDKARSGAYSATERQIRIPIFWIL